LSGTTSSAARNFFTSSFLRHREIVSAKQKSSAASLNLPEVFFTCEPFGGYRSAFFLKQLSSMPRHRVGEAKTRCGFPSICPKLISRANQSFVSPVLLLTVEGPKVPLSRGLFEFVALRFYAEECAFSLSKQAHDPAWDLVECLQYPTKGQSENACRRGHVSGAATAHVAQSRRQSRSSARSCSRDAIVKNSY
jgi:hypothetical protein